MKALRKPEETPTIESVEELTREQVAAMPRRRSARVQKIRDSHHVAARLIALGLDKREVAERSGYSYNGVSMLAQDPAFIDLVAQYRDMLNEEFKEEVSEYYAAAVKARNVAMRMINDKLEDAEPADVPLNQLTALHGDLADRTGYPKRKESVNFNFDVADRLEAATRRIRQMKEVKQIEESPSVRDGAEGAAGGPDPQRAVERSAERSRKSPAALIQRKVVVDRRA